MRRVFLPMLVALVFACACEPEPPAVLPAPRILSISPQGQTSNEKKTVTVQLDVDPRFLVNYGERSVQQLDQPTLRIGSQTVPLDTYLGHGQYQGTVSPGLSEGTYDIQVTLPDGRTASLPQAYQVKEPLDFWLEEIPDQVQDQPFTVTIHAFGTDAELFTGTVAVNAIHSEFGNSTVLSTVCGPFSDGICRVRLTLDRPGNIYLIQVKDEDPNSNPDYSNAFRVAPKN